MILGAFSTLGFFRTLRILVVGFGFRKRSEVFGIGIEKNAKPILMRQGAAVGAAKRLGSERWDNRVGHYVAPSDSDVPQPVALIQFRVSFAWIDQAVKSATPRLLRAAKNESAI